MIFNRCAEYHNILHTVSINAPRFHNRRSGEKESGGEMLDYFARSLSPEDEIIEREEREEKSTAIKRALKATKCYIKTVFDAVEIDFIRLILTTEDTPAKIAKSLQADYYTLSKSLYSKFAATSKTLVAWFRECGYFCSRELDFLPRLAAYVAEMESNRRWLEENAEHRKASKRAWYAEHGYKKLSDEEREAKRKARREATLAKLPPEKREAARKKLERNDRYYQNRKAKKNGEPPAPLQVPIVDGKHIVDPAQWAQMSLEEQARYVKRVNHTLYVREYRARKAQKAVQV